MTAASEHPAETMRRAAARLREAGRDATPQPWRVSFIEGVKPVVDGPNPDGHMVAEMYGCGDRAHAGRPKADAGLIVILRNSAEALAGWLEQEAARAEEYVRSRGLPRWCHRCGETVTPGGCRCWTGALATARAVLGEEGGN